MSSEGTREQLERSGSQIGAALAELMKGAEQIGPEGGAGALRQLEERALGILHAKAKLALAGDGLQRAYWEAQLAEEERLGQELIVGMRAALARAGIGLDVLKAAGRELGRELAPIVLERGRDFLRGLAGDLVQGLKKGLQGPGSAP